MILKNLPYLIILGLIVIIILQRSCVPKGIVVETKVDTVTVYDTIKEVIPGKPGKTITIKDTVWMHDPNYIPKSDYDGLLKQYNELAKLYFTTNITNTTFKVKDYGSVTVTDSIKQNQLLGSSLLTDLVIPTTIITKEIPQKPTNQLYLGPEITGNPSSPISGISGRAILKTKKDQMYSVSLGYNGQTQYGFGTYWKLKIR